MTTVITADSGGVSGTAGLKQSADSSGILALATGTGTTAVTIDTSQNVGIGTSSPSTTLHVSSANNPALILNRTSSTGDAGIKFQSTGTEVAQIIGAYGSNLLFSTGSSYTERARIDSSGNLLVGTTDSGETTGAGVKIIPFGTSANYGLKSVSTQSSNSYVTNTMYSTGAAAYRFYVGWGGTISATSTTITGISDQRLKENIRDLEDGLEKVMALQPRKFDWKEGKGANIKNARGWIAQEFETVFPDMIEEWLDTPPEGEEPYKAVNANLVPTLVKAIQEQQALITQLQADVAALKGTK